MESALTSGGRGSRSIIFYFSGTGNSLRVADIIANHFESCELWDMSQFLDLPRGCSRIGFVFPCYALGLPKLVRNFVETLDLSGNPPESTYYFAVVTYGAHKGNALPQLAHALEMKGAALHFGSSVKMFANYVGLYGMAKNPDARAAQADEVARMLAHNIRARLQTRPSKPIPLLDFLHGRMVAGYNAKGRLFNVGEECANCGRCAHLCPVRNIAFKDGLPVFNGRCEQCMACIQWCPRSAINIKDATKIRGRYHHPNITWRDMLHRAEERRPPATP